MTKTGQKSVLLVHSDSVTTETILERIRVIRDTMKRVAGVLKGLDQKRLQRQDQYWIRTLNGWGEHLDTLATELTSLQMALARRMES